MSYTPPLGNAVAFSFLGQPAYTPPAGAAVAFSFMPSGPSAGGDLALAARAALAFVGRANLVLVALRPLQAACALVVAARANLSNQLWQRLAALGRITLTGQRVTAKPPKASV